MGKVIKGSSIKIYKGMSLFRKERSPYYWGYLNVGGGRRIRGGWRVHAQALRERVRRVSGSKTNVGRSWGAENPKNVRSDTNIDFEFVHECWGRHIAMVTPMN